VSQLKDPNSWFSAARIMACQKMPYFSSAVMGLVPYKLPGIGTLGVTDRGVLAWDPALVDKWSVENLAWVLIHEAGHYLRDHGGRAKACGAEHAPWNIAGDAEINDDLKAAGAVFPPFAKEDVDDPAKVGQPSGVLPAHLGCEDGKLCEEYYAALRKNAQGKGGSKGRSVPGPGAKGGGAGGKGKGKQGQGQGNAEAQDSLSPMLKDGCGSGSGGEPAPWEGDIPKELGKSPAEQKRIQREVAEAVRQAAQKGRGTMPAGIVRWAEDVLGPPRIPWQQKLARLCRSAVAYRPGAGDYRYDRPSRRQSAFGYGSGSPVFPALRMPIPQCAIIVDTSGSMGSEELKTGLEEVKGILSAVGASVDFYSCDTEVHTAVKIRTVSDAVRNLKGGGGTDMKPAFHRAMQASRRPELIVCVTDGCIGDPGPKPRGAGVVWLLVGNYVNKETLTWGEVVEMDKL
jgi:predicted metal-dependent peptidase